jgi:hypothetical protein
MHIGSIVRLMRCLNAAARYCSAWKKAMRRRHSDRERPRTLGRLCAGPLAAKSGAWNAEREKLETFRRG